MSRALNIRNPHAILRLVRAKAAAARAPGRWSPLAPPVFPDETGARMRAQSLLAGTAFRDGSSNPGPLTLAQAQDVLRWATTRIR
jgi:hypothetical protein